MSKALVLAGHGSHISSNTAAVVWDYADKLRSWAVADEITACFWKEQPHFNRVLDTLISETVVIVPLFTAKGYFSQQVIPTEIGLDGAVTKREGRTIHTTRTLGQHSDLKRIVRHSVDNTLHKMSLTVDDVAVIVIGHGTKRSESTRETTEAQVQALLAAKIVPEVVSAYLDDEPNIPSIYERTSAKHLIAVPFFLAAGSHTRQDVPEALGITYGDFPAQVDERLVYYCDPVGIDEILCDLLLELARETGVSFERKAESTSWSNFPLAGASTLREAIVTDGHMQVGELTITPENVEPINSTRNIQFENPRDLRRHIRENPFRPLASVCGLKRDWFVQVDSMDAIPAIVETVYPGAVQDWAAQQNGAFIPETLETVIARQKGTFAKIDYDNEARIAHFVGSVCGRCIKEPMWYEERRIENSVPCASPCNFWLAKMVEDEMQ